MSKKDYQTGCRYFNGYKPCDRNEHCDQMCPSRDIPKAKILIVHLGAIGAVVRATAILKAVRRKHPNAHITWITDKLITNLLKGHPLIDQVYASNWEGVMEASNYQFDLAYVIDKSKLASGIVRQLDIDVMKGFYTDTNGKILPVDSDADYLWQNGLSDEVKFFKNRQTEIEMIFGALGLTYEKDDYCLPLTAGEENLAEQRKLLWSSGHQKIIVGINTGCSTHIPYKKFTTDYYIELINDLQKMNDVKVVLLGGPEDTQRNQYLHQKTGAVLSPTESGLRDGLVSVAATDIVISGDSLGMHMAISQKKWVVAWFGPTCSHEIELYERGVAIETKAKCSPCWKRSCDKTPMCYDLVSKEEILLAVKQGRELWLNDSLITDIDL